MLSCTLAVLEGISPVFENASANVMTAIP
jgi:hypothetical protein